MIAIVTSDSAANVGDLFVDSQPTNVLASGCCPSLAAEPPYTLYPMKNGWLAFYTKALSDATWPPGLRSQVENSNRADDVRTPAQK